MSTVRLCFADARPVHPAESAGNHPDSFLPLCVTLLASYCFGFRACCLQVLEARRYKTPPLFPADNDLKEASDKLKALTEEKLLPEMRAALEGA